MGNLFRMIGELCQQHCISYQSQTRNQLLRRNIIQRVEHWKKVQVQIKLLTMTCAPSQCSTLYHHRVQRFSSKYLVLKPLLRAAALPSWATWHMAHGTPLHWPGLQCSVDMTGCGCLWMPECVGCVGAITHAPLPHSSGAQLLTSDSADHGWPRIANRGVDR